MPTPQFNIRLAEAEIELVNDLARRMIRLHPRPETAIADFSKASVIRLAIRELHKADDAVLMTAWSQEGTE